MGGFTFLNTHWKASTQTEFYPLQKIHSRKISHHHVADSAQESKKAILVFSPVAHIAVVSKILTVHSASHFSVFKNVSGPIVLTYLPFNMWPLNYLYFTVSPHCAQIFWLGYSAFAIIFPRKLASLSRQNLQYLKHTSIKFQTQKDRDIFSKYSLGQTAQSLHTITIENSGQNHQTGLSGKNRKTTTKKENSLDRDASTPMNMTIVPSTEAWVHLFG